MNHKKEHFRYSSRKPITIIGGGVNTAKEYISHQIAYQQGVDISYIIHGDKQRVALFESLSPSDQRKFFPKMYEIFKNGAKGVDLINKSGVSEYLRLEFEESKFVYTEKLAPIIDSVGGETRKILVGVQLLPDLLAEDIRGKDGDMSVIFALRSDPEKLREREEEYRFMNHNHDTYVYSFMNSEIDFQKLPKEDQEKIRSLSEQLRLPVSKYLLHLLAKIEYNRVIDSRLDKNGIKNKVTLIDTSTQLDEQIQFLLEQ